MEQFIDFLIREGCVVEFFHNFKQDKTYKSLTELCEEEPNRFYALIRKAFTWSKTREGHMFWKHIEQKWKNTFEETTAFDRWWNESGIVDEYNDGLRDIALAAWNAANERSTK